MQITRELIESLLWEHEGTTLDFKSEQDKSEVLKDILAFANATRRTDAFI